LEHRKGYDIAQHFSKLAGIRTIFAGPDVDGNANTLQEWIGEIADHKKFCDFVGKSTALFYPSRADAGGMGIWEASALGTPVITTKDSGAQCNVINGSTGFVVSNTHEALEAIQQVKTLSPLKIRQTAEYTWDFNKNFEKIYSQIISFVYNKERW
jgi:glycosyltransferase involved in cell wall biosynthesis